MPDEELLATLKEVLITLQGVRVEVKARRRHASSSDDFVLFALRDLSKILRKLEKERIE